ncbi:hypothetical protein BOX15_Mlig030490g1, partial [Macrostomum lignano]
NSALILTVKSIRASQRQMEPPTATKSKAERTRNVCILAHVDHGKTTLADCLIATNGIIPSRSVARLRYMDSLEQEQERGITMKSSIISLLYNRKECSEQYVVNLIDSPGHIDFSSEVSAAVRLSDGAIVVVDAVEGVSPQTVAVLRQAWRESVTPVLLINKVDRLILELRLSPTDAYHHLWKLIESVNALMAELYRMEFFERQEQQEQQQQQQQQQEKPKESQPVEKTTDSVAEVTLSSDWLSGLESAEDEHVYFAPARGNVVFASALDGWGFRLDDFAGLLAKRLGCSERILSRALWGDYFYAAKEKKVYRGASVKGRKPLFVQLVLENLWTVYDTFVTNRDADKISKMCASLDIRLGPRDLKSGADPHSALAAFSAQWLPVARAVLEAVVARCPSPRQLSTDKVNRLLTIGGVEGSPESAGLSCLRQHFLACSPDGPLVAFASKMMAVPAGCIVEPAPAGLTSAPPPEASATSAAELEQRRLEARRQWEAMRATKAAAVDANGESAAEASASNTDNDSSPSVYVAFCRIYSGIVRPGDRLFLLSPRHRPDRLPPGLAELTPDALDAEKRLSDSGLRHASVCTIGRVLLMRGRDFESVPGAGAGAIVGVEGLADRVIKTATLSATLDCPAFSDMASEAAPIIRVAVECVNPADQSRLLAGLRLLERHDPGAEVLLEDTGENVVCSSGEVHLAKCLSDLRQCYAKVEFTTSPIVVPFRETLATDEALAEAAAAAADDPDADTDDADEAPPEELLSQLDIGESGGKDDPEVLDACRGLVCCRMQARDADRHLALTVRAVPLSAGAIRLLENHADALRRRPTAAGAADTALLALRDGLRSELLALDSAATSDAAAASVELGRLADCSVLAAGPRRDPCNLLLLGPSARLPDGTLAAPLLPTNTTNSTPASAVSSHLWQAIINGFQWTCQQGPLCREPLRGVAFVLLDVCEVSTAGDERYPELTVSAGQLMSHASKTFGKAFLCHANRRLMLAAFTVDVQCRSEVLGKVHAVLAKHQGRIVSEDLREGTNMFVLRGHMPVIESFGLADELRKRTSGFAGAQLRFSHWALCDWDPLMLPREDDDLRDERMRIVNYLMEVRRRKGMPVRQQIVQHADKQRTRSRKK